MPRWPLRVLAASRTCHTSGDTRIAIVRGPLSGFFFSGISEPLAVPSV